MQLKNKKLFAEKNFVDGKFFDKKNKISVFNPANQDLIGMIPNCDETDTKNAIEKAQIAFLKWKKFSGKERAKFLKNWYELILQNQEDLAIILTTEQGKPLSEARGEVLYGAQFVEWFSQEAKRNYGDTIPSYKQNQKIITFNEPVGVVGAITPWNFPSAMITRKAAAAMAAGCSVILKPSELTPFSATALAALAAEAEIPDGVFNVITGDATKIGEEFCRNKTVRKISFTGSTRVGKLLNQQCAADLKRVSLELGGSAPFIVFADANLEKAITGLMHAKFRNGGQACTCVNRIFVEDKIHDQFVEKLLLEIKKLKLGNGLEGLPNIGPMISEAAVKKVENLLSDAIKKGAKCLIGGVVEKDLGAQFFQPTLLTKVDATMQIAHEEIFGAVAAIQKFS
ncbi:MAG: aldehyde dehydrogenase family protein, partial [Rickettsiales bacterium]|nr:aldehyde dehydrogenase family protein [Rickettsiales bacterium]